MQYTKLGRTGLKISRIALGCMTYRVRPEKWFMGEEDGRAFIKRALDLGINFFDTANMYSGGESETVLGRALLDFVPRDEVVVATKVFYPMREDPNGRGLSRKAIFAAIDDSLTRLGTDYVDLYQVHRWDEETPIEETLEALNDVVKAGKARYIGASSMFAWQFCTALHLADRRGWTRFVSMQPHYNLLNREEEREMLPLCRAEGIGVLPWSPLARGRLARPWQTPSSSDRVRHDRTAEQLYTATEASDREIVEAVCSVAARLGRTPATVSLAWLLQKPGVTAPIIGATKLQHLNEAVEALELELDNQTVEELERPYIPHAANFFI